MEPTKKNAHTAEPSRTPDPTPTPSQYERDVVELCAVADGIANAVTVAEQFHAIEATMQGAALWEAGGHLINSKDLTTRCEGYIMLLTAIRNTPGVLDAATTRLITQLVLTHPALMRWIADMPEPTS